MAAFKADSGGARRVALIAPTAFALLQLRGVLIGEIMARRHRVLCLAPDITDTQHGELAALGIECKTYPLANRRTEILDDFRMLWALTRALKAWRPHVVLGFGAKPAVLGALAARRAGADHVVPMFTGLRSVLAPGGGRGGTEVSRLMKIHGRRALRGATALVLHNGDDHGRLRRSGLLPPELPVHVVGGAGVDLELFAKAPLPSLSQGLIFLMIARLRDGKGIGQFCEAARRVKSTSPNAHFVLVGPSDNGPDGFAASAVAPCGEAVEYLGPSDDVRPHLRACHIHVLPADDGEGMPNAILEALAVGRPIITSDTAGCRETVDERVNGCLVPAGDAEALAGAMCSFLKRPDLIASMASASRKKAERCFDLRDVNRKMLAILQIEQQLAQQDE